MAKKIARKKNENDRAKKKKKKKKGAVDMKGFNYLLGEWIVAVALSESLSKDEFTLMDNGDTHSLDTAIGTSFLEDVGKGGEESLGIVFLCHISIFLGSDRWNERSMTEED